MERLTEEQAKMLMPMAKRLSAAQMEAHRARKEIIEALFKMAGEDTACPCAVIGNRLAVTEHQHQAIHLTENEIGMCIGWPLMMTLSR